MAAKHLSQDEIQYVVDVKTSKAQQEIHKLETQAASLRNENKQRLRQMISLEASGKKESEQYRQIASQYRSTGQQLRELTSRITEQTRSLDTSAMTMSQLRKQSKSLQRELDNVSKSLNPEQYKQLQTRLQEVSSRMSELKTNATSMKETLVNQTSLSVMAGNVFTKVAEFIGNATAKVKDFIAAGIDMAESADGVSHAFKQINQPGLLNNLRKATKGTVNDFELMKAAVKANDFRIPLEQLGTYLQFAQLKAQQTGQSVDYMVESITTGLGRKSKMILDNLGISAAEIDEKVKETGDFATAVSAIVQNQLAKAGQTYVSASDKALQQTTKLQNAQLEMGQALLSTKEAWADAYGQVAVSILKVIGFLGSHKKATLLVTIAITGFTVAMYAANMRLKEFIVNTTLAKVATKAWSTMVVSLKGISLLFTAAIASLSGNTAKATEKMKLFNLTCKANVYILAATAILAIVSALVYLAVKSKRAFDLSKQMKATYEQMQNIFASTKKVLQQDIDDIQKSVNKQTAEQTSKIKILTDTINDNTKSNDKRREALVEIKKIVPAYHAQLTNEGKLINNNTSALKDYIKQLRKAAMQQAIMSNMTTLSNAQMNNYNERTRLQGNKNYAYNQAARLGVNLSTQKVVQNISQVGSSSPMNSSINPTVISYSVVNKATGKVVKGLEGVSERLFKMQQVYDYRNAGLERNSAQSHQLDMRIGQLEDYAEKNSIDLTSTTQTTPTSRTTPTSHTSPTTPTSHTSPTTPTSTDTFASDREDDIAQAKQGYQDDTNALNEALATKKISQEQFDAFMVNLKTQHTANILNIETSYQERSQQLQTDDADKKAQLQQSQDKNVEQAKQQFTDAQIAAQKAYNDAVAKLAEQGAVDSPDSLEKQQEQKLAALQVYYQTALQLAREAGASEADVTQAYDIAKDNIDKEFSDKKAAREKEETQKREQQRQQLGLVSQKEQYDAELEQLRQHLAEVGATEEESAKAITDLKEKKWKEQFDYYSSMFSSAFTSLQDAELAVVDAKYDAELSKAKGNADQTEKLETEKANAELKVKKKWADVNFAMTAAQIVANTASGVARQFSDLPLAAAIATGALISIAGTAQLVAANAERQKVKKMTLQSTSSSSSSSGTRVATGLESGGSVDVEREQDGKKFHAAYDPGKRGFVDKPTVIVGEGAAGQSKEWVASNAAVENPTVAPLLSIIDQHQRAGTISMLDLNKYILQQQRGLASGGSVSQPVPTAAVSTPALTGDDRQLVSKVYSLLDSLSTHGIPATVALDEFDAQQKIRERSRKIASK